MKRDILLSKCIYKSSSYKKHVVHTIRIVKWLEIKYYEGTKRKETVMKKIFDYIMTLNLGEKLFLIFFCYGVGYVIGETVKNVFG